MPTYQKADFEKWIKASGAPHDNNEWFYAAASGDKQTLEKLIKQGVQVNTQSSPFNRTFCAGVTALILAAEKGHANVVQMLLSNGADTEIQDGMGNIASRVALVNGHAIVVMQLYNNAVKSKQWNGPLIE